MLSAVAQLSNQELLARVTQLAACEREVTASLIAHLAELDKRRAYLAEGCSSLFTYCTQVLHLSEHAAYGRIEAARAVRRFPIILERLAAGSVTLTAVGLLAAHLTPENHRDLLDMARHKSKRQVEELVARLRPQPPVPASVRKLPTVSHASASPQALPGAASPPRQSGGTHGVASPPLASPALAPPSARPAVVAPLAPERYKVQFTASAETYAKLRLAQALLRHQIPDGELGTIVDRALTALLRDLARKKVAATARPRKGRCPAPGSRHIPADVRRAVWLRDGGRCAFTSHDGRRCTEQGFLEFHHVRPYAAGGASTADNIQLRCRAHNGYEAERHFGRRFPSGVREARASYSHPPEQPRRRSGLGITAVTRSGPSTDSAAQPSRTLGGAAQTGAGSDGRSCHKRGSGKSPVLANIVPAAHDEVREVTDLWNPSEEYLGLIMSTWASTTEAGPDMMDCRCPRCARLFSAPSSAFGSPFTCPVCGFTAVLDVEHLARFELPRHERSSYGYHLGHARSGST